MAADVTVTGDDACGDRLAPGARPLVDALSAAFPDIGGTVTDAAEARRILAAAPASGKTATAVGKVEDRVVPGPVGAPDLPVRIYRPGGTGRPRPTVVFFHGGGYTLCGLDTHDATARTLCAESGAVVVSVAYRLAPEHRFPAATEDAYAALCWAAVQARAGALGGDPAAVVTAGDSSGGGLATVAALMARDREGPAVALQVLIYPVLDAGAGEWLVQVERDRLLPYRRAPALVLGAVPRPGRRRHPPLRLAAARGPRRTAARAHRHRGLRSAVRRGGGLRGEAASGGGSGDARAPSGDVPRLPGLPAAPGRCAVSGGSCGRSSRLNGVRQEN